MLHRRVVREGLRLLELLQAEDRAKVEWLQGAAQEGINAIERGEYATFRSQEAIAVHDSRDLAKHVSKALTVPCIESSCLALPA